MRDLIGGELVEVYGGGGGCGSNKGGSKKGGSKKGGSKKGGSKKGSSKKGSDCDDNHDYRYASSC